MRIFPLGIAMMLSAVLACGGGTKNEPTTPAPAPAVSNAPPAETPAPAEPAVPPEGRVMAPPPDSETGVPECDELVRRQRCLFTKTPDIQPEAVQAFEDSIQAFRDALADERSRMAMIDGCKQATTAADEGLKSMGC